jgi:Tol biopolymer transport system component
MKQKILLVLITVLFIGFIPQASAQFDRERFGKNRIQHKNMEWSFYSSNNFEVYYYDGGQANARMAIDYLEAEFDRLTQMIGYVAYTKPKVFIYNSREDLLQSNLNLNTYEYTIDGQTFFSKLLTEVPYPGEWPEFKEELIFGVSKAIIEEMLYGSTIADAFQSNLINSFPDWFISGAARYLAKGWDREMDDYVRHYLQDNARPRLYRLRAEEAELVGQSIWNFIVEKYGRRYISSILNLSRINRNEENSIANTIGVNYRTFSDQWRNYYVTLNEPVMATFKSVDDDRVIATTRARRPGMINDVKFSPDGRNLAYVINSNGKYRLVIRDLQNNRERVIYRGGFNADDQEPNFTSPVIAWRDTSSIAIATFRRGVTTLRLRSIDGGGSDRIFLRNITQIMDMDFSPNGRNILMSAISNGRRDIYTLNLRGQGRRLTNDIFDNITPTFLNDSTIIFSSNRVDLPDTVINSRVFDVEQLPKYYNLFKMEVGDSIVTTRLTNANTRNYQPRVLNRNFILHLSDQSGIMNISRYGLGSTVSSQVSAFNKSVVTFDYSPQTSKWAYAVQDGIQNKLVVETFPNLDQFTPSTPRVQLTQAKQLNQRISTRRERRPEVPQAATPPSEIEPAEQVKADTAVNITLEEVLGLEISPQDTVPTRTGAIATDQLRFQRRGGIDTDNYVFDTVPDLTARPSRLAGAGRSSVLEAYRQQTLQKRVTGPSTYVPRFIASSLNTTFVVDPLRGFGMSLNAEMTDLLDNHSFRGGIMAALDFRSGSDVFFEYEYLKQRIDIRGRFDRRALLWTEGIETQQRYVLTKAELGFAYPFTVHTRLYAAPFLAQTQYFNLNPDSVIRGGEGPQNRLDIQYAGGRAELVIDRTQQLGLYLEQGFKGKIGFVHYQGLNASERSFSNAYLDFRNYQKISKNITLATRLFGGSFFGNNPQTYMVGGMDNWLFNRFHQPPANRPEASPVRNPTGRENSDILFAEFVDLRGYDYDEIRGNNVITFTAELRVPLFSYLSRGNIASNFVKNFQLVGFYDAGSSWSEAAPWERVNDQNTEVIDTEGSPFRITLNNFNNPWLQSYGAGLRTVLLNYYVKFDVARPIRNYTVEKPRFYVTLGYNF